MRLTFATARPVAALLSAVLGGSVLSGPLGCATSPEFQAAASVAGRGLADRAARYAAADAMLDPATRDQRLSQASALHAASATTRAVTAQGVYSAWAPVEGWLRAYVAADVRIPARLRARAAAEPDKLDKLIADESRRPLGASTRPAGN